MDQLEKYSWLIGKLQTFGKLTHRQLSDAWETKTGKALSRHSLGRWREEIEARLGVSIVCKRENGDYFYRIVNPEQMNEKSIDSWIVNAVCVGHTLNAFKSLADRIICDSSPNGIEYLYTLLEAMSAGEAVDITYRGLGCSEWTFRAEPYAVRQHREMWYVLCRLNNTDSLMLYSLARIEGLVIRKKDKFRLPESFNAADYFDSFFGIVLNSNYKPCSIVVRAYGYEIDELRSKPLHGSQKELSGKEGIYADFSYFITPTDDFINALIGMGKMVEVLSPIPCREKMTDKIRAISERYESEVKLPESQDSKPLNGNFAVIEIEVANGQPSSICEIAVVIVQNGELVKKLHSYVKPEPFYHSREAIEWNGINESDTKEAPLFPEVWKKIEKEIKELPMVGYNVSFEKYCLEAAFIAYGMEWPEYKFYDAFPAARQFFGEKLPRLQDAAGAVGAAAANCEKSDSMSFAEEIAAIALHIL